MAFSPRVTVLMTVYNGRRYISAAVKSALDQRFRDLELLLLDDGSTDDSAEIARSFGDARLRVLRNAERQGVGPARRAALLEARGELVAVLDVDDLMLPGRLEQQVAFLDRHHDVGLLGTAFLVIDEDDQIQEVVTPPRDPLEVRWHLLFGNCMAHSSVMYRRATALALGGYTPEVRAGEDFDLWARFAARDRIAQLPTPLSMWRRHTGSLEHWEPVADKAHFVWTVERSLSYALGRRVGFETARALYRDRPAAASSSQVVRACYEIIVECFEHCRRSVLDRRACGQLALLTMGDLARIRRLNPGTETLAFRRAQLATSARAPGTVLRGKLRALADEPAD